MLVSPCPFWAVVSGWMSIGAVQADSAATPDKAPTQVKNCRRDFGRSLAIIAINLPFLAVLDIVLSPCSCDSCEHLTTYCCEP
jgi:hypothetical protein